MNNKNILCIYHGTCMDGFTAAWVVRKALGMDIEFHAATHGDPPPDVTGKDVIIVDFSYKRPVLLEMAKSARSMLILDHHKSAEEDLRVDDIYSGGPIMVRLDQPPVTGKLDWGRHMLTVMQDENEEAPWANIYALFDMERSGAGIAWDFFMSEPRTSFIDMVEDRDLWKFQYPATRQVCAAIFSYEYTFENWDNLARRADGTLELQTEGLAIERKHHKDIAELVGKSVRVMTIGGHRVPVANLPYTMGSDAGHLMCSMVYDAEDFDTTPAFAAYYWDSPEGRNFGLRSLENGADVSEVAKQYGGGGHRHAAGFRVPFGHDLTL